MTRRELDALLAEAMGPERPYGLIATLTAVVAATAAVLLLGLSGWFITAAALAGAAGALAAQGFNYLLPSAAIRLLAILRTIARYGERFYRHRAALMALATIRVRMFGRILAARDVREASAGDSVTRLVQDIAALEDRLVRRPALPAALAGAAAGLALALFAGPKAALALLGLLIALPLAAHSVAPKLLGPPAARIADTLGRLKADFVGYAATAPEIVAYSLAPAVQKSLEAQAAALDAARLEFARGEALIGAGLTFGGGLAMAAVLALSEASPASTVLAILAAAGAMETLSAYVRGIARDAVVVEALARLEALASVDRPSLNPNAAALLTGQIIELPMEPETLILRSGERLAITGQSGSGKTNLLEELAGIRPAATYGRIQIDRRQLAELDAFGVRQLFALSPQDAQLISGTVCDNLRLARPQLTDDMLWSALEAACLADTVRAMPGGLNSWVGDGGVRLSGGQRKRLSVARALLAGKPWLLLDEPSEGLDPASEALLAERLEAWLARTGTGLILVTHRSAMLTLADRRFDLDLQRIFAKVAADPRVRN